MRTSLIVVGACLCAISALAALDRDVPDAARREIARRGYLVQKVSEDLGEGEADALAEAFAVPADDSHKFALTILYGAYRNAQLDALKRDLLGSKELEPWVHCKDRGRGSYDVESTVESHLHCRFDQHKSPFIPEHWAGLKVLGYPTLILQPPRNGDWGEPATVINQKTGYEGDPAKLAQWLRASVGKYALAYSRKPEYHAARANLVHHEGHRDDRGDVERDKIPPPFPVPAKDLPVGPSPPSPFPPDLVPVTAEVLTSEQIKKIVPEADAAFVLAQLDAKVTTAAEVVNAWAAKALRDKLADLERRLEDRKPKSDPPDHPVLNWLVGSGILALLVHIALNYFGIYTKSPSVPPAQVR
jgi:hypothetical protein